MKFHSDLFGWEYVWRNFADEKGGKSLTDSGEEEGKLLCLSIPVGASGAAALFVPETHGQKMTAGTVLVAYEPADDFAFSIFQEKMHHQLSKALGMQDLKVQDDLFDSKFMIQGNDAVKVQEVFLDVQLRELVLLQPPATLHIEKKAGKTFPALELEEGHHAVVYKYDGSMDKLHQLQTALDVVVGVLEQLTQIGSVAGVENTKVATAPEADQSDTQSKRLRSPLLDR